MTAGLVWLFVGAVILLGNLGMIRFDLWDLWPIVLVIIGASLLLRGFRRREPAGAEEVSTIDATAILGGVKRRIAAADFRGGNATAILGGCEIDLRDCGTGGGPATIDAFAFWGAVEIWVPQEWRVEVKGTAILGAFEDATRPAAGEPTKTLVVRGTAIMAAVEIKS